MSGFTQALPVILAAEGGYVNDPLDRGGATNFGITQATYDGWRQTGRLPTRSVREITHEEVEAIYHQRFWVAGRCDSLPWPLSLAHFDACVNHGPGNAWRLMQKALGVQQDGVPGQQTYAAIQRADQEDLVWSWLQARSDFYVKIVQNRPDQIRFLRGWLNQRVLGLHRAMRAAS